MHRVVIHAAQVGGRAIRARQVERLDNLFVAGADEASWRKGHSYPTLLVPGCRN